MKPSDQVQSFVLNGKRYSFTRSQLIRAVQNQSPRRIDKYQVAIEGIKFPPKQVLELLTGVEPIGFTTMAAQRVLKKFGYDTEIASKEHGVVSAEDRNLSEQYLEYYLQSNGYFDFEFEPSLPGTNSKPDYRLRVGSDQVLLEAKEFQLSRQDFIGGQKSGGVGGGFYDPYTPIRQKIDDARKKFKGLKDQVCCLVLFNENKPLVDLNWQIVYGSMLGNITWSIPFNPSIGKLDDSQATTGFGRNGKCGPDMNTTISAIIVLEALTLGERRFRCHMSKIRGEMSDRKLSWDEIFELERVERDRARGTERDSSIVQWRVVVHENPWASNKLNRSLFTGRFDERYGDRDRDGQIVRIFAGEAVEELEALEREHPPFKSSLRRLTEAKR